MNETLDDFIDKNVTVYRAFQKQKQLECMDDLNQQIITYIWEHTLPGTQRMNYLEKYYKKRDVEG